nr:MAG TPA: Protein of unknown function (DUF1642) [Caudoviricetes sp.]
MNKKELVKTLMERMQNFGYFPSFTNVKIFIREYEKMVEPEPTRAVVPEYIAEWIGYCKLREISLAHALYRSDESADKRVFRWVVDSLENQETFAKAWLDGYEVEKEKRYLVKMKGMQKDCVALKKNKDGGYWYLSDTYPYGSTINIHTRKELEEAGFGWVFDCPGIEIEEVE